MFDNIEFIISIKVADPDKLAKHSIQTHNKRLKIFIQFEGTPTLFNRVSMKQRKKYRKEDLKDRQKAYIEREKRKIEIKKEGKIIVRHIQTDRNKERKK